MRSIDRVQMRNDCGVKFEANDNNQRSMSKNEIYTPILFDHLSIDCHALHAIHSLNSTERKTPAPV